MRTPANGHARNGRPAEEYRLDEYRRQAYPADGADGYATGRYTSSGYEPAGSGREPDIAGSGYPTGRPDLPTETFPPVSRRRSGPDDPAELHLDPPPHRTAADPMAAHPTAPPPLRPPARSRPAAPDRSGWSAIGAPATPPAAPPAPRPKGPRLRVDWPNCKAHGLCHELLPEVIRLDEWGYPIVGKDGLPPQVVDDARRAVTACPTLALRIVD